MLLSVSLNNAAGTILTRGPFWTRVRVSLGYIPRGGIAGSRHLWAPNSTKYCQLCTSLAAAIITRLHRARGRHISATPGIIYLSKFC